MKVNYELTFDEFAALLRLNVDRTLAQRKNLSWTMKVAFFVLPLMLLLLSYHRTGTLRIGPEFIVALAFALGFNLLTHRAVVRRLMLGSRSNLRQWYGHLGAFDVPLEFELTNEGFSVRRQGCYTLVRWHSIDVFEMTERFTLFGSRGGSQTTQWRAAIPCRAFPDQDACDAFYAAAWALREGSLRLDSDSALQSATAQDLASHARGGRCDSKIGDHLNGREDGRPICVSAVLDPEDLVPVCQEQVNENPPPRPWYVIYLMSFYTLFLVWMALLARRWNFGSTLLGIAPFLMLALLLYVLRSSRTVTPQSVQGFMPHANLTDSTHWVFQPQGFEIRTVDQTRFLDWENIDKVSFDKRGLLIFHDSLLFEFVPKTAFADDEVMQRVVTQIEKWRAANPVND